MPFLMIINNKNSHFKKYQPDEAKLKHLLCPYSLNIQRYDWAWGVLYTNASTLISGIEPTKPNQVNDQQYHHFKTLTPQHSPKIPQAPWLTITADNLQGHSSTIMFETDPMGMFPLWYIEDEGSIFITPELKSIQAVDAQLAKKLFQNDRVQYAVQSLNGLSSPYTKVNRLTPGQSFKVTAFRHHGLEDYTFSLQETPNTTLLAIQTDYKATSKLEYETLLKEALSEAFTALSPLNHHWAVMMSGGIDSCLVSAWLNALGCEITNYTLYSHLGSEVNQARHVSNQLKVTHHSVALNLDTIIDSLEHIVTTNECFDGLSVETLIQLLQIITSTLNKHDHFVSGYGCDLLFSSMLSNQAYLAAVGQKTSLGLINRSLRSGEFSPFFAWSLGTQVYHAYWHPKVVQATLTKPVNFNEQYTTFNTTKDKLPLRHLAVKEKLLSHADAFRNKTSITEGTKFHELLAQSLNLTTSYDYESKSSYCFDLLLGVLDSHNISHHRQSLKAHAT